MESLIHDKPQIVVSKEKEVKPLLRKKIKLDNLNKMKIVNLDENEISPCIRKPKEEKIEIKKAGVGKELKNSSRRGRKNIPELENKTEPKKKPIEIKKSFISEVDLEKELKKFSLNPIEKKKGCYFKNNVIH